jgi:putative phosphoesterase
VKLGLISDLHGDAEALEQAWGHLQALKVDRVLSAGDVVGYGPRPDDVASFLKEQNVSCVCGNHDRWALSRPPGTPDEFGGASPSEETLAYLRTLPPDLVLVESQRFGVVVHGSPYSDMEFVTPQTHPPAVLRGYLELLNCDFLVVGHTHEPMWYRCDRGLVVNPGSVISLPVVKSSRTFAVLDLDDLSIKFYRVDSGKAITVPPWPDETGEQPGTVG